MAVDEDLGEFRVGSREVKEWDMASIVEDEPERSAWEGILLIFPSLGPVLDCQTSQA